MKRKVMMAVMLAALVAVPVFAATTDQNQESNEAEYNLMINNHKQMIQQAVEHGSMTAQQVAQMNEYMQQMMQSSDKMNSSMPDNCGRMGNSNSNK
jgi:Spy/CpxP family protein refolding chaperone